MCVEIKDNHGDHLKVYQEGGTVFLEPVEEVLDMEYDPQHARLLAAALINCANEAERIWTGNAYVV